MATEKETLQTRAEELGLETEGTIVQLKEWIATAEAEDAAESAEAESTVESAGVVETSPQPVKVVEALPEAPIDPPKASKPTQATVGGLLTYEVKSAFWLQTAQGGKFAQLGGKVRLTETQAKKYLRHKNIELIAA